MAPSMSQGAVNPLQRRPAMNVWLSQWPNGTAPGNRSPIGALPRSRVSFVLVEVSSMNTSRCGMALMMGSRLAIQVARSLATSARARSLASSVFFIAEAGLAQEPRQRGRIDLDAMACSQLCCQFRHGDVGSLVHAPEQERAVRIELARPRRTPLRRRLQRARARVPCHELHRERRADGQVLRRTAPRLTASDTLNHPLAKIYRIASPHDPPPGTVNHSSPIWGIPDSD